MTQQRRMIRHACVGALVMGLVLAVGFPWLSQAQSTALASQTTSAPATFPATAPATGPSTFPATAPTPASTALIPLEDVEEVSENPVANAEVLIGGSLSAFKSQEAVSRAFTAATSIRAGMIGQNNAQGFKLLAQGKMQVLVYSVLPTIKTDQAIKSAFKAKLPPKKYPFGQFATVVVVHKNNPIPGLSFEKLRDILTGKIKDWQEVGGKPGKIVVFGESDQTKSWEMLKTSVLGGKSYPSTITTRRSDGAILSDVGRDVNALGFFLYRQREIKEAKVLPLKVKNDEKLVAPTDENVFDGKYPLAEELVLYLPANASHAARWYCEFAQGPEAAKLARSWFLYPEYDRQQLLMKRRIAEWRAGRGPDVQVVGSLSGRELLPQLGAEFVRTQAVLHVRYKEMTPAEAVGAFVGGAELLISDGPINSGAMAKHKIKWEALVEAGAKTQPASQPTTPRIIKTIEPPRMPEYVIAGRAVTVVVPLANKLDALTADQLRGIFIGQLRDWKLLNAIDTPGRTAEMHCYCLDRSDPAYDLFFAGMELRDAGGLGPVIRKKSSSEVLAALATDAMAIGFVDVAALPVERAERGVKVLGIRSGDDILLPDPQMIAAGKYPLAQRLHLYVHPQASQLTWDYVKFITMNDITNETYRRNGYISALPVMPKPWGTKKTVLSPAASSEPAKPK